MMDVGGENVEFAFNAAEKDKRQVSEEMKKINAAKKWAYNKKKEG